MNALAMFNMIATMALNVAATMVAVMCSGVLGCAIIYATYIVFDSALGCFMALFTRRPTNTERYDLPKSGAPSNAPPAYVHPPNAGGVELSTLRNNPPVRTNADLGDQVV